jgi:hypothetical protein
VRPLYSFSDYAIRIFSDEGTQAIQNSVEVLDILQTGNSFIGWCTHFSGHDMVDKREAFDMNGEK